MRLIVLKKGMICKEVGEWQSFLRGQNLYLGKIDDDFGNLTHNATKCFQKRHRLFKDGVVGNKTWGKAIMLGFDIGLVKVQDNWYPPKPDFKPIVGNDKRMSIFGEFEYEASPTARNPERIMVDKGWKKEHIVWVDLPALKEATNGKHRGMNFHRLGAEQLEDFFNEIHKQGLHKRIISFSGAYYPRFIRGSRKTLSNHSWGTAFDINAWQNWLNKEPAKKGEKGYLMDLVPIANHYGFYWGGHFTRKDGMHFEIAKIL